MKCPKCGSENIQTSFWLSGQMQTQYSICDGCTMVFTQWQQDEISWLREGLRRIPYEDSMTKRIDMAKELLK